MTLLTGAIAGALVVAVAVVVYLPADPPPPQSGQQGQASGPQATEAKAAAPGPARGGPKSVKLSVDGTANPFVSLREDERTLNWQTRVVVAGVGEPHALQVGADHRELWAGVRFERADSPAVTLVLSPAAGDTRLRQVRVDNPGRTDRWVDVSIDLKGVKDGAYQLQLTGDDTAAWLSRPSLVGARGTRPNLILVSIDTLRADYLGVHGYDRFPTSPWLDGRAAEGIVHERVTAPSPWTVPSHTAMLTGTDPDSQGMARQVGQTPRLPSATVTLAERFRDAGYLTLAFTGRGTLAARNGFVDGFYLYQEATTLMRFLHRDLDGNIHNALGFLSEHRPRGPFFMFFHTFDAHAPYAHTRFVQDTPDPVDQSKQAYASGIAYVDQQLQRFFGELEALGLLRNTVVVVTSDHGEGFLEHPPHKEHGETLYDEFLHVPLVVWGPNIPTGRRVSQPVGLVDLFATVLDLFELPDVAGIPSRSLRPLWGANGAGEGADPRDVYLCCIAHGRQKRGLRTAGWKYFYDVSDSGAPAQPRIFDLSADPQERSDLSGQPPPALPAVQTRLQERAARNAQAAQQVPHVIADPDMLKQLRALGYIQ